MLTLPLWRTRRPRVDKREAAAFEIADIPGYERRRGGKRDSSNHHVDRIRVQPAPFTPSSSLCRGLRCRFIER
jgi:hypothetical protein